MRESREQVSEKQVVPRRQRKQQLPPGETISDSGTSNDASELSGDDEAQGEEEEETSLSDTASDGEETSRSGGASSPAVL